MIKDMQIIEKNQMYVLAEADYMGTRQRVRLWRNGKVEFRFNDEFARANGYNGVTDMVIQEGMTSALAVIGGVPEWIEFRNDMFIVTGKPMAN